MRWLLAGLFLLALLSPMRATSQDIPGRGAAALAMRSAAILQHRTPDGGWRKVCSAVVWAPQQVLTAAHCLTPREGEFRVVSAFGGVGVVAGRTEHRGKDLAVLDLPSPLVNARSVALASTVALGDTVWIAGAPGGVTAEIVVLSGRIARSQPDYRFRNTEDQGDIGTDPQHVLWVNAQIVSGSSGAGVLNDQGQLVGVVVRVYMVGTVLSQYPLYGFAVGLDTLREVLR